MKGIMQSNIYEPKGVVAIVGSCLEQMQPKGFEEVTKAADMIYTLCLEETHINMAVTKIGALLSTGQVKKLILASVDRSPHCTQMHYIKHELERMMPLAMEIEDYVVVDNRPVLVSDEAIDLSKSLSRLMAL